MSKKNPLNKDEREREDKQRVSPSLETEKVGGDKAETIVKMVIGDADAGRAGMADWIEQKKTDLQHRNAEKPSIIENLNKRSWQSDRNLGVASAVCDIYQATLLKTCYNPDRMHFVATEKNDVDLRDSMAVFAKWMLGAQEVNATPEVDDFIANRVDLGFSVFKIYWKVWYEYVDERIPIYSSDKKRNEKGRRKILGYKRKTVKRRFERGVLKNVDDLDDVIVPNWGKHIQDLKYVVHVLHYTVDDLKDLQKRGIVQGVGEEFLKKIKEAVYEKKKSILGAQKMEEMGLTDVANMGDDDADFRNYPIDLYEWYGEYEMDKRKEKQRFLVEPTTETLLAWKPLRKVTRDGKYPFSGGAFVRRPGQLKGWSLIKIAAPIFNCINNEYNQEADARAIRICPPGFMEYDEEFVNQAMDVEPFKIYPKASGTTVEFMQVPAGSQGFYQNIQLLFQVLEKITGAASYFLTTDTNSSGTATRDMLVSQKSETKFGLWVERIMIDICEAINMLIEMYQDWAPKSLGDRVLGEEGNPLIMNFSIDSIRGRYDARMDPDVIQGSKLYERQLHMWGLEVSPNCPWVNPQLNPRGNWKLWAEAFKSAGFGDVESILGPEPEDELGKSKEVDNEWQRFIQGDEFDPPEGVSAKAILHYIGHMRQKAEKYSDLPETYRGKFDDHLFQTRANAMLFMQQYKKEQAEEKLSMGMMGEKMQQGERPSPRPIPPEEGGPPEGAAPPGGAPTARPQQRPKAGGLSV